MIIINDRNKNYKTISRSSFNRQRFNKLKCFIIDIYYGYYALLSFENHYMLYNYSDNILYSINYCDYLGIPYIKNGISYIIYEKNGSISSNKFN